ATRPRPWATLGSIVGIVTGRRDVCSGPRIMRIRNLYHTTGRLTRQVVERGPDRGGPRRSGAPLFSGLGSAGRAVPCGGRSGREGRRHADTDGRDERRRADPEGRGKWRRADTVGRGDRRRGERDSRDDRR